MTHEVNIAIPNNQPLIGGHKEIIAEIALQNIANEWAFSEIESHRAYCLSRLRLLSHRANQDYMIFLRNALNIKYPLSQNQKSKPVMLHKNAPAFSGSDGYVCGKCGASFESEKGLHGHQKKHRNE